MTANTKLIQRLSTLLRLLLAAALLSACLPAGNALPGGSDPTLTAFAPIETVEMLSTSLPEPTPSFTLPKNLALITPENAQSLHELTSVYPYFPSYYHISDDGMRYAMGDMQTVEIREAETGNLLSTIPTVLPDCDFGFDRYFRLNEDGTFIALVNGQNIEVWRADGGLIFSSPISSEFSTNAPTCGADLPEMALSPDGKLLALSGIAYGRTTSKRYFRLMDVRTNEIVYEWNGAKDSPHGNLYTFYGLGFSDDGRMLQTFDPTRFIRSEGEIQRAFRFWSVETWQEVNAADEAITQHFDPGQLLFPYAEDGLIEVRSRLTGAALDRISMEGCLWDAPCETRFSADGNWAVVIERGGGQLVFKNDVLNSAFTVWDLTENKAALHGEGALRDLESLLVKENGSLIRADQIDSADNEIIGWWTFRDHFNGLQTDKHGKISFTPLAADSSSEKCQFCSTCTIDMETGTITCRDGIADNEGGVITLKTEGGKISTMREDGVEETSLGVLDLPEMAEPALARVRTLGYSPAQQTLFYCADEAQRQVGCYIYDTSQKETLETPEDISFLRFSADGLTASFFNRADNALFLYDLPAKKLTRKSPYQSRSTPVNAVFSKNASVFQYLIQYQNNANDLSVETLDAKTWKSYGRISLVKAGVVSPTAFLESDDGSLWAFAGKSGEVWLLSPDKGVLLHRFQAHLDDIIGMALAPDGTWLLTMGENGILKFWGIEE